MTSTSFANVLDRHFRMNQDYLLDHVHELLLEEKELCSMLNATLVDPEHKIPGKMRKKLVEWMIQLCDDLKLGYKTKQASITLVDIALTKLQIHKNFLQLLGVTCVFISIKCEESFIYTLAHACEHCANSYTKDQVSAMEMLIMKALKWKLHYPTPGDLARRFVHLTSATSMTSMPKFFKKIDNFIDLCLSENDIGSCPPSCIAAASVMCAFENSQCHVEEWRQVMISNGCFELDFDLVDKLYQSIIEKLLKVYPDYFTTSSVSSSKDTKEGFDISNANADCSLCPEANLHEASGISFGSQETLNNSEIILEELNQITTPSKDTKESPSRVRASLLETERLIRQSSRIVSNQLNGQMINNSVTVMDEEKHL